MFLAYLKLSLRILVRTPVLSAINIAGLALGFASFIVLSQHSFSGLNIDRHHRDSESIFRLIVDWRFVEEMISGSQWQCCVRTYQFGMILDDFPAITDHTMYIQQELFLFNEKILGHSNEIEVSRELSDGNRIAYKEIKTIIADPNLFQFFNIPLLRGNAESALADASSVVISQSMAKKYFGDEDPIGQMLIFDRHRPLTVTGVFEDLKRLTTHLDFNFVLSDVAIKTKLNEVTERRPWAQSFVKLRSPSEAPALQNAININMEKYWETYFSFSTRAEAPITLQPVKDVAFSGYLWGDEFQPRSRQMLGTLMAVSVLIITMAWINYVNLTISKLNKRQKEIGVRKATGATAQNFAGQFIIESVLYNTIALITALTVIQLAASPLELLFRFQITNLFDTQAEVYGIMIALICTGVVVTGLYPSYLASKLGPASLITQTRDMSPGYGLTVILTTVQYIAATVLIICSFVMFFQLNLVFESKPGMNTERVLIVESPAVKPAGYEYGMMDFVKRLRQSYPVTFSNTILGDHIQGALRIKRVGQRSFKGADAAGGVDDSFIPFYGLNLIAGRNFEPGDSSKTCILSRQSTKRLEYANPEDAIGTRLVVNNGYDISAGGTSVEMEVIGVIEDYRTRPLIDASEIRSLTEEGVCLVPGFQLFPHLDPRRVAVQVNAADLDGDIARISRQYNGVFPGSAFAWYLLDDHINRVYKEDVTNRNQIWLFTFTAIGIACLGLLGIFTNRLDQKTKEIGIRKVLGAGILNLGFILLRSTLAQVALSIVVGIPIAYMMCREYLSKFTVKIDLEWWHFMLPVALLGTIMLLTILSMLLRTIKRNPADSLRYE